MHRRSFSSHASRSRTVNTRIPALRCFPRFENAPMLPRAGRALAKRADAATTGRPAWPRPGWRPSAEKCIDYP